MLTEREAHQRAARMLDAIEGLDGDAVLLVLSTAIGGEDGSKLSDAVVRLLGMVTSRLDVIGV